MSYGRRATFAFGLGIRLVGVLLIWLGDGSSHPARKAVVILGVVLSVGGIGVLRYLLCMGLRKKKTPDGSRV